MRVVTLALNVPGPLAAKRLLDLGASVIKVEPPQGDPLEHYCLDWYQHINVGQQRKVINLKSEHGQIQFAGLLSSADLLLTAQRTKALNKLGLEWESIHNKYPKLNHIAIVGYLPPNDDEAGHDLTYQATLGLLNQNNMPKTLVADMAGAETAALESLAFLMATKAGEVGQKKLVALSEAAKYMAQPLTFGATREGGLLAGVLPEYSIYQTQSGSVAIAALEPHFSSRLKKELGLVDLSHENIAKKLQQQSAIKWEQWAKQHDIPLTAVKEF